MKRLLKPRDKLTLLWFSLAVFALYRYAWERPLSVAMSIGISGGLIYAGILIALNERNRKRKCATRIAVPVAHMESINTFQL